MPSIQIIPSGAYPSIPDPGDTIQSHTLALQAIKDSLETGERRDGNYPESFITFQELVDLGIIDERGEFIFTATTTTDFADLSGTVNLDTQVSGTLSTAFAEAGLINTGVTINADGTLTGAGGGQASLTSLPGSVQAGSIAANAVTAAEIAALTITAAEIVASTITASKIAANTITANQIAASTITAAEMNVSNLAAIAADLGSITAGDITLDATGFIKGGQTAYNTGTGFWLGKDGASYKFSIGTPAGNRLTWDGSILDIVGDITGNTVLTTDLSGTINLDTQVSGTLSTAFAEAGLINTGVTINADGTLTGAGGGQASLTSLPGSVQAGSIAANAVTAVEIAALTITAAQIAATTITASKIVANTLTAGQIAANTITATEMNVSNLAAIAADLGSITAGDITLDATGFIKGGQTAYDTGSGFWLGKTGGAYKFSIGNSAGDKLTWDGTDLAITGNLDITNAVQTFTPNWLGFSTAPTGDVSYIDYGAFVTMWVPGVRTGTSSAVTMAFSGIPVASRPSVSTSSVCEVVDSNKAQSGGFGVNTAGTVNFKRGKVVSNVLELSAATFSNTGTKGLQAGWVITYPK